jgi:hypothetical protein
MFPSYTKEKSFQADFSDARLQANAFPHDAIIVQSKSRNYRNYYFWICGKND